MRLQETNAQIQDNSAKIAGNNSDIAAIMAKGRLTASRKKAIAEIEKDTLSLKENTASQLQQKEVLESTLVASEIAEQRIKEHTQAIKVQNQSLLVNAIQLQKSAKAMKLMTGAASTTGFFLTMTASNTREMVSAMIAVPIAVGAIKLALEGYNNGLKATITLQAAASGGMSLLIGLVAAFVAYEGTNWLMGATGVLDDAELGIHNINNELTSTLGLMDELSQRGDATVSDLLGETTYNQLKQSSDLTAESLSTVKSKIDDLTAARDAGLAQDSAEYKALDYQIKMHQQTYNEIAYIYDAHQVKMNAAALAGEEDRAQILGMAYADISVPKGEYAGGGHIHKLLTSAYSEKFKYEYTDPYTGETFTETVSSAEALQAGFGEERLDMQGNPVLVASASQRRKYAIDLIMKDLVDVNRETAEEVVEAYTGAGEAQIAYADNVLQIVKDNNQAIVDDTLESADAIVNEFDNMRQELFFGEQRNFQGALFKEIRQNGVENLLYKTEILQTNNFYGLTFDEATEKIEEGIISRMRAAGVPI